ncbi:serine/threonine-protein kinase [Polyangium jinanense]|uniref:Protein kinase n=1 Tax=Polyangium jinanense TaxID=2829994 RepID=A0A9X4ARC3_9BACT|nr:serine/threonine protein kinase [Polyangium jinanense]MDC3952358.1 protein kinase [Polyangium jinanense]MDC3979987.1 protein kinase [Polyangium jinanense]
MSGGELIGDRYGLVRQIGTGALGAVWEAEDHTASRHVALKLLSIPNQEVGRRLGEEARAAQAAKHPTLVTIHDVGETGGGEPFVAMELLSGETLADRLARERTLPPPLAAQIGRDIASALSIAHAARLVHGDLRPANVFLHGTPGTNEPVVKLLDLWVARAVPAVVAETLGLGSPSYRSPEQLATPESFDVRTDLWSLGVVLFEMLSGQRPFEGGRADITARITSGPVPRISQLTNAVDPALEEIVARCMERERDKRIGSAMVVAHMLEVFAAAGRKPSLAPAASVPASAKIHDENTNGAAHAPVLEELPMRGQLGTLVMAESAPSTPSPALRSSTSGSFPAPSSGPLGTLLMAPPSSSSPRAEESTRRPRAAYVPPPRASHDSEPTQVYIEPSGVFAPPPMPMAGAHIVDEPTEPPPTAPPPGATAPPLFSARQQQMTVTELHQRPAQRVEHVDKTGFYLAVAVGAATVLLIGFFVIFLFF